MPPKPKAKPKAKPPTRHPPPPRTRKPSPPPTTPPPPTTWPTPALTSAPLRQRYRIGRGEQGVLTFEPYKSLLLPHWRFRTLPLATRSAGILHSAFASYVAAGDFVGADMARKFLQMGMTRARRYGNFRGGRKYGRGGEGRVLLERSQGHPAREEKMRVAGVFEGVWRECRGDEGYGRLKGEFLAEQRGWEERDGEEGG
ncbi:hypothetical protein Tdes44962_MAKER02700 [Teratosphaeria destructans]|uniref:Uncharacterized protein n=1 Tax=Teratosphaeria destructans TaxID=418781 RepID=A0A9W7W2Q5_9PEZI|nr:hypothetical protein Tdes44962_MAKER02700 [Teratosphaeria destructans]